MILTILIGIVFLLLVGSLLLLIRFFIQNGIDAFKRKGFYIPVIIVTIIALSSFIYVFTGKKKAEKLTWEYLERKGYTQQEVQRIDVTHSFLNIILSYNEWNIAIIYTNEPTSTYHYTIKDGNLVEGGISGTTDKEDLKH